MTRECLYLHTLQSPLEHDHHLRFDHPIAVDLRASPKPTSRSSASLLAISSVVCLLPFHVVIQCGSSTPEPTRCLVSFLDVQSTAFLRERGALLRLIDSGAHPLPGVLPRCAIHGLPTRTRSSLAAHRLRSPPVAWCPSSMCNPRPSYENEELSC